MTDAFACPNPEFNAFFKALPNVNESNKAVCVIFTVFSGHVLPFFG